MLKKQFSIILAFVFVSFTMAPTIISFVSSDTDVSMFYALGEEDKEAEEKESQKTIELITTSEDNKQDAFKEYLLKENTSYYLSSFEELHVENISPPPEQIIL